MSFRDSVTFSMMAGDDAGDNERHGDRVAVLPSHDNVRLLPFAALYGGNASGKSNLFEALRFVQKLVTRGTKVAAPLDGVRPFLLASDSDCRPTVLSLELLATNDEAYRYSFSVTNKAVQAEKLVRLNGADGEQLLFHRKGRELLGYDVPQTEDAAFNVSFKAINANPHQLLLSKSVDNDMETFKPIYDWFEETLILISPDAVYAQIENLLDENHHLHSAVNKILPRLDSGIARLRGGENIPLDSLPLPSDIKQEILDHLPDGASGRVSISPAERFVVSRKNGHAMAQKMVARHRRSDGKEIDFDMWQESDGTRRLIDLLPALIAASRESKVCIIDEMDRSLHPKLVEKLIDQHLAGSHADTRSQLIVTTHDVQLMSKYFLRSDELWLVERDKEGASSLFSLSELADNKGGDAIIRAIYMRGGLGGAPRILLDRPLRDYGDSESRQS